MPSSIPCIGIIPARYDSSRFPGKPLALIAGKPMFQRVYERASSCPSITRVLLATDDNRIYEAARKAGVPVVMTSAAHHSGTDRVLEAARTINAPEHAVIVNIQGDEPALAPAMLTELTAPFFTDPSIRVTTLATPISAGEAQNPNRVKVVTDEAQRALYFSRAPIPYPRDEDFDGYLGHVGLYAFRMETLELFSTLPQGTLEQVEKLEQLRLLENGIPMHVGITCHQSLGVDHPDDIPIVEDLLRQTPEQ
ncbi:3-deoxy-manno-octulosonate cytidylyltransferase [Desulfoluna spongiiphila]|uniref:3-deoxy-manno-octulosonate cytidylyltransferase n=1 Tax=Desulfoluna spongiiphila TaxID=419481 RepID=A0A1G5AI08_9BACT|nr:3-deoxy-manno-octulosonate cytidylyltransferase [Desulfoluna spongiiphila]SCX77524.1 3-deoxy-manno-octulosonate cytidylyltransferase (CMP-KDO synthetase) [Desulfoluna spongiiphila]